MVKKADLKLVDGKESVSNVSIILKDESLNNARDDLIRLGKLKEEDRMAFKGPDFKDISAYSVSGPFFVVALKGDVQYIYPISDIARIKTYITYKE